ncbi:MAG: outer membrane protein assembly factor BamC [Gammaproteobacteria bacterium]|nr:MAG: outer membrane protein assembly factor BamC [Gammaproteobacteria bacterium]
MNKFLLSIVLLPALILGGCSSTKEKDYTSAAIRPPLEVPPGLSALPNESSLPVRTSSAVALESRKRDPVVKITESLLPRYEGFEMRRAGSQRWLVVKAEAEPLWFKLKGFIRKLDFEITLQNPETGILETNWKENDGSLSLGAVQGWFTEALGALYSTGLKDQFRFRLEHGNVTGTMEVFISHRGMEEVVVAGGATDAVETLWQPRAADPELEAELLKLLMVYLGSSKDDAIQVGDTIRNDVPAVTFKKDEQGQMVLLLADPLEQAWRRVGISLDRVGFTVQDRDRAANIYYVHYIDPAGAKSSKGLFGGLFDDDDDADEEYFQISIQARENGSEVRVLNRQGVVASSATSEKILRLLSQQLQ